MRSHRETQTEKGPMIFLIPASQTAKSKKSRQQHANSDICITVLLRHV